MKGNFQVLLPGRTFYQSVNLDKFKTIEKSPNCVEPAQGRPRTTTTLLRPPLRSLPTSFAIEPTRLLNKQDYQTWIFLAFFFLPLASFLEFALDWDCGLSSWAFLSSSFSTSTSSSLSSSSSSASSFSLSSSPLLANLRTRLLKVEQFKTYSRNPHKRT